MDAFYASVEVLFDPSLKGRPVAVGGSPAGRGVIAAASYEARRWGVRSAMASAWAIRLCPGLILVPPRFERYRSVSERIRRVFLKYGERVEMLALDEAWIEVSRDRAGTGSAIRTGRLIQNEIGERFGLSCSVGVSFNKTLAKMASEEKKPGGFFVIGPRNAHAFLMGIPVERISGVGKRTAEKMHRLGIRSGRDLYETGAEKLRERFGKFGERCHRIVCGIDRSAVGRERPVRSISRETTFENDRRWDEATENRLRELAEKVWQKLNEQGLAARTLALKVKFDDFRLATRSFTRSEAYRKFEDVLSDLNAGCTAPLLNQYPAKKFRLLGFGVSNLSKREALLDAGVQIELFG